MHRLLEKLALPGGNWFEPGAGEGNLIKAVNRNDINWTALELREECKPFLEALEPTPEIILRSVLLAAVMGIFGGFLPAIRAARISPIEAMRA